MQLVRSEEELARLPVRVKTGDTVTESIVS